MQTARTHALERWRRRGRRSPLHALVGALVLVAAALSVTGWQATHVPWLGIELATQAEGDGVAVVSVWADGPAAGIVVAGDVLSGIGTVFGEAVSLGPADLVVDPDVHPTFASLNAFLERQDRLAAALAAPVTVITTADGRTLKVQARPGRSLRTLPADFWLFQIYGATAVLVGTWVWLTAGQRLPALLILASGLAFLVSTASASLIVARELALPAATLRNLVSAFHLGNNLFSLVLIALMWHYPRRVGGRLLLWLFAGWLAFAWLNERYQWHDLPGHNVGFQVSIVMLVGIVAVAEQWWATRGRAADRAVVKFLLLALVLVNIIALLSYYHAAWLSGRPLLPLVGSLGLAGLFYLALVIGVVRYRMFDVERWWLHIWLWLAAGVGILGLDILVSVLVPGLGQYSLVLVLVLVGWIYFPLRQWLWEKAFPAAESAQVLQSLPAFMLQLVTGRGGDPESAWRALLDDLFQPLETARVARMAEAPRLLSGGERLYVPGLESGGYELRLANHGARLLYSGDLALAGTIHDIAARLVAELEAYRRGVMRERERIMRDLHDEVGGRLLTLIHECRQQRAAEAAREALEALRDVIYLNGDGEARVALEEVVARWRRQTRKRLARVGVKLDWDWDPDMLAGFWLSARAVLNLGRILQEAVNNALRHASPGEIRVAGWLSGERLHLLIANDGVGRAGAANDGDAGDGGQGMENMKHRAAELGGSLVVEASDQTYRVEVVVPLVRTEERAGETLSRR